MCICVCIQRRRSRRVGSWRRRSLKKTVWDCGGVGEPGNGGWHCFTRGCKTSQKNNRVWTRERERERERREGPLNRFGSRSPRGVAQDDQQPTTTPCSHGRSVLIGMSSWQHLFVPSSLSLSEAISIAYTVYTTTTFRSRCYSLTSIT